jgi:hypothetical protein
MKRWIIGIAITLVLFALVARLIIKGFRNRGNERKWYVENLNYNFSAEIDSIRLLNKKGFGFIICHPTNGNFNISVEDSLVRHLKHHKRMRFLTRARGGNVEFISGNADQYLRGDSVCINSENNKILIYRKGNKVYDNELIASIRGAPF